MNQTERWVGQHRQIGEVALDDEDVRLVELAARTARRRYRVLVAGYFVPFAVGLAVALAIWSESPRETPSAVVGTIVMIAFTSFVSMLPFATMAEAADPVRYGRRGPLIAAVVLVGAGIPTAFRWSEHASRLMNAVASAFVVALAASTWIGFHAMLRRRAYRLAARGLAEKLEADAKGGVAYEMETTARRWPRAETPGESSFEPVFAFADPQVQGNPIVVLPRSSILFRVGDRRVVDRLRLVKVTEIDVPGAFVADDRGEPVLPTAGEQLFADAAVRTLTDGESAELRALVTKETRSFGWRTLLMAYWCLQMGRLLEMVLGHDTVALTPRAAMLGAMGFGLYLWFRVPPLRAVRRDMRDRVVVRVTLDPYRGGATAEVLRHSGRVWSQQGAPSAWRTVR